MCKLAFVVPVTLFHLVVFIVIEVKMFYTVVLVMDTEPGVLIVRIGRTVNVQFSYSEKIIGDIELDGIVRLPGSPIAAVFFARSNLKGN